MLDVLVTKQDIFLDLLGGFLSTTGLTVLDNLVLGFVWIRWVSSLLPATSGSNSFVQRSFGEFLGGGRGGAFLSRVWSLRVPARRLSRYNTLGEYRGGWLRCILFDRTSILFVEKVEYRPNTPSLGVLSTVACTMQDVVWSDQAHADLCDPCPKNSQAERILSVFCSNFVLQVLIQS